MKNVNRLGLVFGVGTIAALSFSLAACGDDTTDGGSAGMATGGASAGATTGGAGASTGGAGASTGGSTTGGAGASTGGAGASTGGASGGGGAGGKAGAGGGGAGGAGGSSGGGAGGGGAGGGGGASPMCANTDDPANMEAATCTTYCADAVKNCDDDAGSEGKVADMDKCMTFCQTFSTAQLCCRAYHAKNAANAANPHCKHTIGVESCQ